MIISLFDRVENIVGKGEKASQQHFLLFPQCFEKTSFPDTSKVVILWEWVIPRKTSTIGVYLLQLGAQKIQKYHQ